MTDGRARHIRRIDRGRRRAAGLAAARLGSACAILGLSALIGALHGAPGSAQAQAGSAQGGSTQAQGCAPDARAPLEERVLTSSSQDAVPITATFSGQELFVYGAIARNRFLCDDEAPPDVAIVIRGPSTPVLVRRKAPTMGVWVNAEAIRIAAAPSFYAVASTRPLSRILRADDDLTHRVSLDNAVLIAGLPVSAPDPESFRQAVIRLRRRDGLYRAFPDGVSLRGKTLFETNVELPANIVEGLYEVRVYLIRDRRIRDWATIELPVRLQGVERALFVASRERPLLYGILTLIVALLAGWSASEIFRWLRR